MRNFQDIFEKRKLSFINTFSICMTYVNIHMTRYRAILNIYHMPSFSIAK